MATNIKKLLALFVFTICLSLGVSFAGDQKEPQPTLGETVIAKEGELNESGARLSELWKEQKVELSVIEILKKNLADKSIDQATYDRQILKECEKLYEIDKKLSEEMVKFSNLLQQYMELINMVIRALMEQIPNQVTPEAH